MRRLAVCIVALAALGAAACSADSGDFKSEAENFIEDEDGELATQQELTFDNASCEEPASTDVGETFFCTATASDGQAFEFLATIEADDRFSLLAGLAGSFDSTGATTPGGSVPTGATTPATTPTS